jgi:TolB protein
MPRQAEAADPQLKGRIVFASDIDGDYELFVMAADGSHRRRLTDNDVDDFSPAWAPGGRRVVFLRERASGDEDIFILHLRSGTERPWVVTKWSDEGEPEWSPDGDWIAFRGNDGGDGSDVVAFRVDRAAGRVISSQDENSTNHSPTWSPDGNQIGLVEEYDESDIYVASFCCSNGFEKRQLTSDREWKSGLDWSPGGGCILFTQEGDGLYAVSTEGGEPRELYSDGSAIFSGSWSPDGKHIVFSSDAAGSDDLYVIDADGSDPRRLTTSKTSEYSAAWYGQPAEEPSDPNCSPPEPMPSPTLPLP